MKKNIYTLMSFIALMMVLQPLFAADTPSGSGQKRKCDDVAEASERPDKRARTGTADQDLADRLYAASETFRDMVDDTAEQSPKPKELEELLQHQKLFALAFFRDEDNDGKEIATPQFKEYLNTGIFNIVRDAQDDTPQALQDATKQRLDAIADVNTRGETAVALLEAANFFAIEPIMQATAQGVAKYLQTPEALAKFNNDPEGFIVDQIWLTEDLADMVTTELLEPFKNQLTEPILAQSFDSNDRINRIALSSDGNLLALLFGHTKIELRNPETNELIRTLEGSFGFTIAFSPDGNLLAAAAEDDTVKIWNSHTGQLIHTLAGHTNDVNAVAFSPDSLKLASVSNDQTIKLWDSQTGQLLQTLTDSLGSPRSLAFERNGKQLAAGNDMGRVNVWNLETGTLLNTFAHSSNIESVAFSPDGNLLASAAQFTTNDEDDDEETFNVSVKLWNTQTGQLIREFIPEENDQEDEYFDFSVSFSPIGNLLVTAIGNYGVTFWDPKTGQELYTVDDYSIGHFAFNKDGTRLVTVSTKFIEPPLYFDTSINVWKIEPFKNRIKQIDLQQAMYIYYKLAGHEDNDQLLAIYESLPVDIKNMLGTETEESSDRDESEEDRAESSEMASKRARPAEEHESDDEMLAEQEREN